MAVHPFFLLWRLLWGFCFILYFPPFICIYISVLSFSLLRLSLSLSASLSLSYLPCFDSISTFLGYLMPKLYLSKNSNVSTTPGWIWKRWQLKGTLHSPKLHHYWNFTIRLFSVTSRTLIEGDLPLCNTTMPLTTSTRKLPPNETVLENKPHK